MKKAYMIAIVLLLLVPFGAFAAPDAEIRKQEIKTRYNMIKPFYTGKTFDIAPNIAAPYSTGKVNIDYLRDGLAFFNFQRFVAGIPDDITLSDNLTERGQHGAVLLAANNELTHTPNKPNNMDQSFYEEGYKSVQSSNLSRRHIADVNSGSLRNALLGQAEDSSSYSNLACVGHRRWLLSYNMKYTGFGVADNGDRRYSTVQVFDDDRMAKFLPSYILWPSALAFPIEFTSEIMPWSIMLNVSEYERPELDKIFITLKRLKDGHTWFFDKNNNAASSNGRYFNVNNEGYGGGEMSYCIIFRPEGISKYSGVYEVSVSGLKKIDGAAVNLDYSVEFFNIDSEPLIDPGKPIYQDDSDSGSGGCNAGVYPILAFSAIALLFARKYRKR